MPTPYLHFSSVQHRQEGLSLIELMVALAISLFLLMGISYIYTGSKQTYRVEENLARMQESGRLAFEYLSRDIRQAGDFGCASKGPAYMAGGSAAACAWPSATVPTVICTLGGTGCSDLSYNQPVSGYEATSSSAWSPSLPTGLGANGGTDVLTIARTANPCEDSGGADSAITIDKDPPGGNAANIGVNLTGTALTTCIQPGDVLVASDCKNTAIFQACAVNSSGIITHDTGNNGGCSSPAYGNTCKDWGNNYKGGTIRKVVRNIYYVKNDPDGIPTLYRKNIKNVEQALVPNIENFQLKYGVAPTADDYPADYKTANNVSDWSLVKSVRVEILVRSPDNSITTETQKLYFNDADYTPTDKRLRLALSSTTGVRNRTLLSTK